MRPTILALFLTLTVGGSLGAQARPDFSGEWVLLASPLPTMTDRFNVRQTSDLLVVESSSQRFEIRLDGTESVNLLSDVPPLNNRAVSTATWGHDFLTIVSRVDSRPTTRQRWMLTDGRLLLTTQILTPTATGHVVGPAHRIEYARR